MIYRTSDLNSRWHHHATYFVRLELDHRLNSWPYRPKPAQIMPNRLYPMLRRCVLPPNVHVPMPMYRDSRPLEHPMGIPELYLKLHHSTRILGDLQWLAAVQCFLHFIKKIMQNCQ